MAKPRDYKREYAQRVARAQRRGFFSAYAETYTRAVNRRLRATEDEFTRNAREGRLTEAERRDLAEARAELHRQLTRKRGISPPGSGWFTLPIWIYRLNHTDAEQGIDRLGVRVPISPITNEPYRRWVPYPPSDAELSRTDFIEPQEADNYCFDGTPALWWLWPKQLADYEALEE